MGDVDELYTVKTAFYVGDYEAAIGEARGLRLKSEAAKLERDVYVHRCYIGLGSYSEAEGISDTAPVALQGVKLLATYLAGTVSRSVTLMALEDSLTNTAATGNPTFCLMAGTVYLHEGDYAAALRVVSSGPASMEQ